ncbi:hypothetical protein T08_4711 [Trichinella sp. T8]|nr:hypothetical protein T08_4711 [Trichinella sp. T8]
MSSSHAAILTAFSRLSGALRNIESGFKLLQQNAICLIFQLRERLRKQPFQMAGILFYALVFPLAPVNEFFDVTFLRVIYTEYSKQCRFQLIIIIGLLHFQRR